jgi:tetratricopeptide (TPR) repeat protein/transcriptional regulator with XRE-family HTH domain
MAQAQVPSFGTLLRRHRRDAGLTQEELAERAGLSVRGISDLERDVKQRPHRDTVDLLAAALHLDSEQRDVFERAARGGSLSRGAGAEEAEGERISPLPHHGRGVGGEGLQALPIGGFLGSLPAEPLVARRIELERTIALVDVVREGRGRLALLAGEPGAGKTRLAQEVTLAARDRGFVIAAGRCYEAEQTAPFYVMREALAALHAICPPSLRAEIPRRWPDVLRLLPNQTVTGATGWEGQEEQQRLFWQVTGFIQACAELAPLAILLDDLHWADASSLRLLVHLAHQTLQHRVLLLGAYRDVEAGRQHPLERVRIDLDRDGLVERIAVRRLGEEDTAALMATSIGLEKVSDELAELVYRRTEGNPFFVQQVMRSLVERGGIYQEDGRWQGREVAALEVPESIRAVIGQRLSRLPEMTQEVLREASILGQNFSFEDLLGMGERSEEDLEAELEEACRSGLIRETGKNGYGFDHALTQQALTAELSARKRRRLHLAAADALERLPERVRRERTPEIALHLVEADAGERALPYCLMAGQQAHSIFAPSEAEWQYRTALELAREIGDLESEREALEGLGKALFALARFEETIEVLGPLAEMCRLAGDSDGEARVEARIARAHIEAQRKTEGIARAAAVAQRLDGRPSPGLARLYSTLSWLYSVDGDWPGVLAAGERAVAIAEPLGDDSLLAYAENARGNGLRVVGRNQEALVAFQRARELGERTGDLEVVQRASSNASFALSGMKRYEDARRHLEEGLDVARRIGLPWHIAYAAVPFGNFFLNHGSSRDDWDAAERYYEEAARAGRSLRVARTNASTLHPAKLRLLRGDRAGALREMAEVGTAARRAGDFETYAEAEYWLAWVDFWEDRPERAVDRLGPLLQMPDLEVGFVEEAETLLSWAYYTAARLDAAETLVTRRLGRSGRQDYYLYPRWIWCLARLKAARGRRQEATEAFEDALERLDGLPYYRALCLFDYGKQLASAGAPEAAREKLAESLSILQGLGARLHIPAVERALTGISPQGASSRIT